MPKGPKVYPGQRREWLDRYESGTSIPQIATSARRETRTITKHLAIAADERERAIARTQLYKDAIVEHNNRLIARLTEVRDSFTIPPNERFTSQAHFPQAATITVEKLVISDIGEDPQIRFGLDYDPDAERLLELVREHLKSEKSLWKALDRWIATLKSYVKACYELGRTAGEHIINEHKLNLVPQDKQSEGVHERFLEWVCRLAIEGKGKTPEEKKLLPLNKRGGQLYYGDSAMASSSSPGTLKKAREVFLSTLDSLQQDVDRDEIRRLNKDLDALGDKLKREVGDVLLLGVVTGRCAVCGKLGM